MTWLCFMDMLRNQNGKKEARGIYIGSCQNKNIFFQEKFPLSFELSLHRSSNSASVLNDVADGFLVCLFCPRGGDV